jgi:prevent-host-death family protein
MKTIGVRELRQRASEYLKAVEAGGSFEITAHGRPVALLVQARTANRRDLLMARGRLAPARGDLLDLGAPVKPRAGAPTATEELAATRADER